MKELLKKKKREAGEHSVYSNIFYMFRLLFSLSPRLVAGDIIINLACTLPSRLLSVVGIKYVIDAVQGGVAPGRIVTVALCFVAFIAAGEIAKVLFFELYAHREREKLYLALHSKLYAKAASLDLENYDDPSFYNDFILAVESSSENIRYILTNIRDLIASIVSAIMVASVLFTIDPVCSVIVIVSAVALVPIGRYIANLQMERRVETKKFQRRSDYFARLFYLPEYAQEIRSNGIFPLLMSRFVRSTDEGTACSKRFMKKISGLVFLQVSGSEIIGLMFILTAYLGYCVLVKQSMTAGDFVASFNGAMLVGNSIIYISIYCVRNFTERSKIIEKYRVFLNSEPKITDGPHIAVCAEPETITISDVSFNYRGNDKDALNNVSIEIRPGEKVALVGYNGAGKTTLTNLLLRLYDVQSGSIEIGGRDIREETVSSHRDRFTAVFQDFQLFGATVAENVAMETQYDEDRVRRALEKAGFDRELPDGLNTVLLREFSDDGVMLSGGEAQKIAIARTFYKECPYVILDEPSANLDAVAEYELNHAIMTSSGNKTVIVISHRLSTAKSADRIIMLDSGRVAESGSHAELMAKNGKYAEMFNLQAEKYRAKVGKMSE